MAVMCPQIYMLKTQPPNILEGDYLEIGLLKG